MPCMVTQWMASSVLPTKGGTAPPRKCSSQRKAKSPAMSGLAARQVCVKRSVTERRARRPCDRQPCTFAGARLCGLAHLMDQHGHAGNEVVWSLDVSGLAMSPGSAATVTSCPFTACPASSALCSSLQWCVHPNQAHGKPSVSVGRSRSFLLLHNITLNPAPPSWWQLS